MMRRISTVAVAALFLAGCGGSGGPPSIAILSPGQGPVGTVVTLQGTGLGGTRSVTFAGKPALFRQVSDREVLATVPAGFTTGPVGLTTVRGSTRTSVLFIVSGKPLPGGGSVPPGAGPVVSYFYPATGPPGQIVDIHGTGLGSVKRVRFAGADAIFKAVGDDDLRTVVPPRARTGPIDLVAARGAGATGTFTVVPLH
jgi:hypothetical protein